MKKKKFQKGRKRRKQNNILFFTFGIIMLVGMIAFCVMFNDVSKKNQAKELELEQLELQKKEKQKELNKKTMEVKYYQSDENIEKIAREELGLVMPQEVEFIIQDN